MCFVSIFTMDNKFHRKSWRRKEGDSVAPIQNPFVLSSSSPTRLLQIIAVVSLFLSANGVFPPFPTLRFTTQPSSVFVAPTSPAQLDCAVQYEGGRGTPVISWYKVGDDVKLADTAHRRQLSNGSLYFSPLLQSPSGVSEQGVYRCGVTVPGLGTLVSRQASLRIAYLEQRFDREPQDQSLALGEFASFQCVIQSQPPATVTWYKDGNLVSPSNRIKSYPTGSLQIGPLRSQDFGSYKCRVSVPGNSKDSRYATLEKSDSRREGIPQFLERPRSQRVVEGENVFLHCLVDGLDRNGLEPKVSWLKDGTSINFSSSHKPGMELLQPGTLHIKDVKESDAGVYTCRAVNMEDSYDADASLVVLAPPTFIDKPASQYAKIQQDLTLTCGAQGQPRPRITWLKNGDPLSDSEYFKVKAGGNMHILGLVPADSGLYQCMADNEVGEVQTSAQLIVLKEDEAPPSHFPLALAASDLQTQSPRLLPPTPTNLVARLVALRYVTLKWKAKETSDVPNNYSVLWKEIGSERKRISNTSLKEFNIQGLKPRTKYEIRVRAYNSYGSSPGEAHITVTTGEEAMVPSPPTDVSVIPLSSRQIQVTWAPPVEPKGTIQHYLLIYYKEGSKSEEEIQVKDTTLLLKNLHSYSTYSVSVVAVNENGRGVATLEQTVETFSSKPSTPPQNFTLKVSSSTSLIIRWEPPAQEDRNGPITGYKIRYRRKGDRQGQTVTTDKTRNTYAFTELRKDTVYQVRIAAVNVNGTGPATPWKSARTYVADDMDESKVPPMPANMVAIARDNSIHVSWAPPPPYSKVLVKGYILGYGLGIAGVYEQTLDANVHEYTIENLKPSSEYIITVQAFNAKGPGRKKYESVTTSLNTYEEPTTPMIPPLGLHARVLSSSTILLTWKDNSLSKSQKIADNRYYVINYRIHNSRNKFTSQTEPDLNAYINGLRPNTEYAFKVKVIKGRRQSDFSMLVINKTEEDEPTSEPRDVTPVPLDDDPLAVSLNWQPPTKPNGQITGYLIYYSNDLHIDDVMWPVELVDGDKLSAVIDKLTPATTYHFKVQARNAKGLSPKSKAASFVTPQVDPSHPIWKKIKKNNNYNTNNNNNNNLPEVPGTSGSGSSNTNGNTENNKEKEKGLTTNVIIIIAACAAAFVFCLVVIIIIVCLCKRRNSHATNMDKHLMKQQTKLLANSGGGGGGGMGGGMKPPDLWIHQSNHLEMSKMERSQRSESSVSVATSTLRRDSRGSADHTDDQGSTLDRRRNSFVGECGYPSSGEERYQPIQPRNIIRPKPVSLPPDAGMMQSPNGHLMGYPPMEGHNVSVPMRPIYPRTQYNTQYSNAARVNAGDIPHTCGPSKALSSVSEDERSIGHGHHGHHHSHETGSLGSGMDESINSRIGYVKPQPTPISPYKKPTPPVSNMATKPQQSGARTPVGGPTIVASKSPEMKTNKKSESDMSKSLSTEELTAEMANLEGLMKDLNAITQQEFEC